VDIGSVAICFVLSSLYFASAHFSMSIIGKTDPALSFGARSVTEGVSLLVYTDQVFLPVVLK
jgi:hypothetical protein